MGARYYLRSGTRLVTRRPPSAVVLTAEEASAIYGDADSVFGEGDQEGHMTPLSETMNQVLGIARGVVLFDDWRRYPSVNLAALASFLASHVRPAAKRRRPR